MKNPIIAVFAAIIVLALLTPLLEVFNVFTEKMILSAALLNSCRGATNDSLSDDYNDISRSAGDLNASIDRGEFMRLFAGAFSATLGISVVDDSGPGPVLFAPGGRWGPISVGIEWEDGDTSASGFGFGGRGMSSVRVDLTTPYIFKTGLLRKYAGSFGSGNEYIINESVSYIVQIIN